jgi:hypothetical protein
MQAWAEVAHLRHCSAFRDLLTGEQTNFASWHCTWSSTHARRRDHSLAELEAGGGRAVAALLLRAAQLPSGDMAADMCVDACWEKLHTGNWSEVWLDANVSITVLSPL